MSLTSHPPSHGFTPHRERFPVTEGGEANPLPCRPLPVLQGPALKHQDSNEVSGGNYSAGSWESQGGVG
jgi:hypothetical protein